MKKAVLLLIQLLFVPVAFAQNPNVGQRIGPEVVVNCASADIFPASWLTPEINAKADLLPIDQQQRGRRILDEALSKYPQAVLKANLQKVYAVQGLSYRGVSAGGTNSRESVYVIIREQIADIQSEEIFHAEFSSILLRNFPSYLDTVAWQKNNPAGFQYRGDGVEAIRKQQASEQWNDALLKEGFLNDYAKASIEEDFNAFSKYLLTGNLQLWKAMTTMPSIKAKADLVIAFYKKIDPRFTWKYFSDLRQANAKVDSAPSTP